MRMNSRTILVVLAAVAVLLIVAISMRGDGRGMMHRLGVAIHGR
jgi:hypothetical protein